MTPPLLVEEEGDVTFPPLGDDKDFPELVPPPYDVPFKPLGDAGGLLLPDDDDDDVLFFFGDAGGPNFLNPALDGFCIPPTLPFLFGEEE